MGFFKDFIIDKFPYFFREYDTYKDDDGKGIFTRFSETMSEEIDINVKPDILNVINQKVAYNKNGYQINPDLLNYLNLDLGGVFRSVLSDTDYRRLLANIVDIYKYKGTIKGYEKLFFFFNYTVSSLTTLPYTNYIHDQYNEVGFDDILHDTNIGGDPITHDHACRNCMDYSFELTHIPGTTEYYLTDPGLIQGIIDLVEPVWANITTIIITGVTPPMRSSDDIDLISNDGITLYAVED